MQYNSVNNTRGFEMSDKHHKLLQVMQEFGIVSQGYIPYKEAVQIYYEWLYKKAKPIPTKLFGEYSFRMDEYELLTQEELNTIFNIFRSYKPKKWFSGVKMYCRTFATHEFYNKERAVLLKPGDVLWETVGLEKATVMEMARCASESSGANIKVYDARGIEVAQ